MENWTTVYGAPSGALKTDLRPLWQYRHLILLLVRRDLRVAYTQTFAGVAWLFLQPLLSSLIYVFVFSVIARVPIEGVPPFLYIYSGVSLWMFLCDCTLTTANTFLTNGALFSKVYFPRLCMPIASVMTAFCHFLFRLTPLIAFMIYSVIMGDIAPQYGLFPVLLVVFVGVAALGMALGLTVASFATRYRDLLLVLGPALQFGMFASPVLYQLTMVPEPLRGLMAYNPMAVYIDVFRHILLGLAEMNWGGTGLCLLLSCVFLWVGVVLFSRAEKSVMDQI